MEKSMSLGERIKYYRKKLGLSQDVLSVKSGISSPSISDYENNKAIPRRQTLEKLAQALNVDIEELLRTEEEPKEEPKPEIDNKEKELELFRTVFKDLLMDVSVKVPVYGTVPAGKPEEAGDEVLEYIKMPKEIASTIDYALKVKGMSMIEAGILENSLVFVKIQSTADDGDIVIARKGNDYTIKRFRKTASESWLEPANNGFVFGKSEFQIVGLVKDVLRILKE
jgi:repressor LexA